MKHELKLNPFTVPNFAIARHPADSSDISIPISDLSKEAVEELIEQFARDVRAKHERKKSSVRHGGVAY